MMAVRYHGCTCHLRYSAAANQNQNSVKKGSDNSNTSGSNEKSDSNSDESNDANKSDDKEEENKSQPWYFHVVASVILVVHGLTFLETLLAPKPKSKWLWTNFILVLSMLYFYSVYLNSKPFALSKIAT